MARRPHDVHINGQVVRPGERRRVQLPAARLPTQTQMTLPVEVVNGTAPGPRLWLSAAIHGDELNGLEIIQRVLDTIDPQRLKGELVAAPIVNVFGFISQERYLPDRRDLNRSFPGSPKGSSAARLAHLFMTEVVGRCTHGIDLHSGSNHRTNLPQVRGDLTDPETRKMAKAFGAPIMIQGEAPRGSLRAAVTKQGVPILVYEAGEPQRFNADAIEPGVAGCLAVMDRLKMWRLPPPPAGRRPPRTLECKTRTWVRARRSGLLRLQVGLGDRVKRGDTLGTIHDAFGDARAEVKSPEAGMVIGRSENPLINQGDAMVHLATELKPVR